MPVRWLQRILQLSKSRSRVRLDDPRRSHGTRTTKVVLRLCWEIKACITIALDTRCPILDVRMFPARYSIHDTRCVLKEGNLHLGGTVHHWISNNLPNRQACHCFIRGQRKNEREGIILTNGHHYSTSHTQGSHMFIPTSCRCVIPSNKFVCNGHFIFIGSDRSIVTYILTLFDTFEAARWHSAYGDSMQQTQQKFYPSI